MSYPLDRSVHYFLDHTYRDMFGVVKFDQTPENSDLINDKLNNMEYDELKKNWVNIFY